ncbi:uncharacterized protein LOC117174255 [Belonocnema kinseyi]|uniref:uncharacterized protein LOC117174255 n=1 Tax=Belonocnema kinseyi TaxID=2817044 RepID=UPI00143DB913|nr:uncharacterized protein LOC117174255 [Belonocnema kinseyi]
MAHFRLFFIVFVATCWYASMIDTAVLRSENFPERLQKVMEEGSKRLRIRRDSEPSETNTNSEPRICYSTPCGWAVYVPFTRRVEYFMKNTCECYDESYKCVRTDDDLSVSAYVYKCRQNTTSEDIESPDDAN